MNTIVTQAIATGMPVIVTRHSGLPDQVRDGESGLIVAEGDPVGLAEAILNLIAQNDRWPQMGRVARSLAKARFDSRTLLAKQIAVYEEVIKDFRR